MGWWVGGWVPPSPPVGRFVVGANGAAPAPPPEAATAGSCWALETGEASDDRDRQGESTADWTRQGHVLRLPEMAMSCFLAFWGTPTKGDVSFLVVSPFENTTKR